MCTGRYLVAFVALAVFACLFPAHSPADEEGPPSRFKITAKAGFGGLKRDGEWMPLRITLGNLAAFSGDATVRVDIERGCSSCDHGKVLRRFAREVHIEGEAETTLIVPFRPSGLANICWVYVIDKDGAGGNPVAPDGCETGACPTGVCPAGNSPRQDGTVLASAKVNDVLAGGYRWPPALNVALVSPSEALKQALKARDVLGDREMEIATGVIDCTELVEDAPLYGPLDALIVGDIAEQTITAAQRGALRDWVIAGGRVVLTRGCIETDAGAGLLSEVCGGSVSGAAREVTCTNAAAFFTGGSPSFEPLDALPLSLPSHALTVADDGAVVFATMRVGLGRVTLVPFHTRELHAADGKDRVLHERIWGRILEDVPRRAASTWKSTPSLVPGRVNLSRLAWPYAAFVLLSALVLGPMCTILARRRQRRIHVLWLIPAFAVVLCAVSFVWAGSSRGFKPHIETVSLAMGQANAPRGYEHLYVGLFSGHAGDYTLGRIAPNAEIKEDFENTCAELSRVGLFPPTIRRATDGTFSAQMHMNRWSMRFIEAKRCIDMPALAGTLAYEPEGAPQGRLHGWVRNDSQEALEHASLLFKWYRQPLGTLAPGQRVELALPLTEPPAPGFVLNPYYKRFNRVSDPLNLRHWPDRPFSAAQYELLLDELLRNGSPCQVPTIVGFLRNGGAPSRQIDLLGEAHSRDDTTIALWRLPIEPVQAGLDRLPRALSVAKATGEETWEYAHYVWLHDPSIDFAFPPSESMFEAPEVTIFARRTTRFPDLAPAGKTRHLLSAYDWSRAAWAPEVALEIGEMRLPDSARFVRPIEHRVRIRIRPDDVPTGMYLTQLEVRIAEGGKDGDGR